MFTTNIVTVTEERCHVWGADSDNCSAHWQGLSHQCLSHLAYSQERWCPEEMLAECPDSSGGRSGHVPPYTGQGQELLVRLWRHARTQVEPPRETLRASLLWTFISVLNFFPCYETGSPVTQASWPMNEDGLELLTDPPASASWVLE